MSACRTDEVRIPLVRLGRFAIAVFVAIGVETLDLQKAFGVVGAVGLGVLRRSKGTKSLIVRDGKCEWARVNARRRNSSLP
jgi:hypothetical protein